MALVNISIENLRIGMYLEYPVYDKNGILLLAPQILITEQYQIDRLSKAMDKVITIDADKSKIDTKTINSLAKTVIDDNKISEKTKEFVKERKRIAPTYHKALNTTKKLLNNVRFGKNVSSHDVEGMVGDFVDSVYKNEDALLSLTKLEKLQNFDDYTFRHSVNVSIICVTMGKNLGYSKEEINVLGTGGILHDIGKMKVPLSILNKPGRYTDYDRKIMNDHPIFGAELLKDDKDADPRIMNIVLEHHERWDGTGYPNKKFKNDISEFGLIASIADVYDALTTERVYKEAMHPHKAMSLIFKLRNKDFSSSFVELFAKDLGIYPVGSLVKLSDKTVGLILSVNRINLLAPRLRIIIDGEGNILREPYEIDLAAKTSVPKVQIAEVLDPLKFRISPKDFL